LKTIGSGAELVYYTPSGMEEDTEFGYFLHVLIPINNAEGESDEEFYNKVKELRDEVEASHINSHIESLIRSENRTHQARNAETGLLEEDKIGVVEILDEYKDVSSLNDFVDFMFKYTSDTATLTADMPYVIGYSGNSEYSGMVEEFTDEAIRLLKEDEKMTSRDNFVVTQYGIHLLYNLSADEFGYDMVESNIPMKLVKQLLSITTVTVLIVIC